MFSVTRIRKHNISKQYLASVLFVLSTSLICYYFSNSLGYQVVALILLLMVSLLAMIFDIFPVMLSALLSALVWNFFFIPPLLTFHIDTPEDSLLFSMYFIIASINAVLSFKIREFQQKVKEKEEKEKSIKFYNTLLNSLSHEFRTPISTIIGSIDTIKDNSTKLSDNNKQVLLNEIETAGLRLDRQVENLLNMSRLETGVLQTQPDWVDINELIFLVIQLNKDLAQNHHLVFNPNEELPLYKIDRGLTEHIINNILRNAFHYTPDNTTVKIIVNGNQDQFIITIEDNGLGFPEREINHVFDKFYRIKNTAKSGTGLGLSIVKGFTEAQNGNITLKNNESGGASFKIEIPAESTYINNLKHE